MSLKSHAVSVVNASDPIWDKAMEALLLAYVPEAEVNTVRSLIKSMRVNEVERGMRYIQSSGNTKKQKKYLQDIRTASAKAADMIKLED